MMLSFGCVSTGWGRTVLADQKRIFKQSLVSRFRGGGLCGCGRPLVILCCAAPGDLENDSMVMFDGLRATAALCAAAVVILGESWPAAALNPGELATHRAIYELKLAQSRSKSGAVSAR